jgi:hypothetical protein
MRMVTASAVPYALSAGTPGLDGEDPPVLLPQRSVLGSAPTPTANGGGVPPDAQLAGVLGLASLRGNSLEASVPFSWSDSIGAKSLAVEMGAGTARVTITSSRVPEVACPFVPALAIQVPSQAEVESMVAARILPPLPLNPILVPASAPGFPRLKWLILDLGGHHTHLPLPQPSLSSRPPPHVMLGEKIVVPLSSAGTLVRGFLPPSVGLLGAGALRGFSFCHIPGQAGPGLLSLTQKSISGVVPPPGTSAEPSSLAAFFMLQEGSFLAAQRALGGAA